MRLALRQGSAAEAVELIRTGSVDLAVAALREADAAGIAGVDVTLLAEEPLRAIFAEDDPLGERTALEDLRGRTFVLAEPGTALRELVMAACQAAGFSPVPLLEVGDPWTTRQLVGGGLGSASCRSRGSSGPGRRSAWRGSPAASRACASRCWRRPPGSPRSAGCSPSACQSTSASSAESRRFGRAPISWSTGSPARNSRNVGIDMTP